MCVCAYVCVVLCVCVCVHACVHACMCVCVCKVSSAQGFVICSEYIGTMLQAQYFPRKQNERLNTRVHTHIHTLHTNWPWHRCLETRVHRDTTFAVCLQTNTVQTQFLCVWPSANTHQQDITLKLEKYTQVVVVFVLFFNFIYAVIDENEGDNWWYYESPFQFETTWQGRRPRLLSQLSRC